MVDSTDSNSIPPALRATALGHKTGPPSNPASAVRVDAFGSTDRGKVRSENQDHFFLGRLGRFAQRIATSLPAGELPEHLEEAGYVAIFADGMGGHAGGEIASR